MNYLTKFKKIIEEQSIHMNYAILILIVLLSLGAGFFLYGLVNNCLCFIVAMAIWTILKFFKLSTSVNVVALFSQITSNIILTVFLLFVIKNIWTRFAH